MSNMKSKPWGTTLAKTAMMVGLASMSAKALAADQLLIPVSEEESLIRPQREVMMTPAHAAVKPVPTQSYVQKHRAALDLALNGNNAVAISMLSDLLKTKAPSADEQDRVALSLGRVQYQAGHNEEALAAYAQVRKGSASWLESLEERASAEMRLGRMNEALASLKTVLTPLFSDRVRAEPYYLTSLAQLRTCDFRGVLHTLDLFKDRFRSRVKDWKDASSLDPAARVHLRETSETIEKLNLVEAEVIQRLYMDENGKRRGGSSPNIEHSRDELTFPSDPDVDSKEVWIDEVDNYHVTSKGCVPDKAPLQAKAE